MEQFKFNNYARRIGSGKKYEWYEWKVFMDESPEKLNKVSSVEYRLHPTFREPIHTVNDRDSKFALNSAGWGTFRIDITVYLKDGKEVNTTYDLDFGKPWPSEEPAMYKAEDLGLSE